MYYRSVLASLVVIILVDITSAQEHVTIDQTHGYNDTWANMNATCSLLGVGRTGNMWANRVSLDNTDDIRGTGWISAHVDDEKMLQFRGCAFVSLQNGAAGLEVTNDRIPECIYFCRSNTILLHRNYCYCRGSVSFNNNYCMASRCGNNEPLFCGQSETASSKCMCRYRYSSSNVANNFMGGSCQSKQNNCTLRAQHKHSSSNITSWHITCQNGQHHQSCDFDWNGFVRRKVFYWGTSPTTIRNRDYCVALRRTETTNRFIVVSLPCSSKQTGICIKGTRISTTAQTTHPSTVTLPTSPRTKVPTTDLTSHAISQHTSHIYPSTINVSHQAQYLTSETVNKIYSTTTDGLTSAKPSSESSEKHDETTDILWPTLGGATKEDQTSDSTMPVSGGVTTLMSTNEASKDEQETNSLGTVLGGVGALVFVIVSLIVVVVLVKKRRRKSNARSHPPHELNNIPSGKRSLKEYKNCAIGHRSDRENIHAVDSGEYDSIQTSKIESKNVGYDLYDHTSGSVVDNTYGRLNQNGRGIVSQENADIYDHSRIVNGDTYDSFQTGVGREDCSDVYYDHTSAGETYGYLEKGGKCKGQIDDIYDHSRVNIQSDGETYDTFQNGRGQQDVSEDYYDHTGVNTEYGFLQKGGNVKVQVDNDYDTMNVAKNMYK